MLVGSDYTGVCCIGGELIWGESYNSATQLSSKNPSKPPPPPPSKKKTKTPQTIFFKNLQPITAYASALQKI